LSLHHAFLHSYFVPRGHAAQAAVTNAMVPNARAKVAITFFLIIASQGRRGRRPPDKYCTCAAFAPELGTLYELTKLDDETFDARLKQGVIRPDMERSALKVAAQVERRTEHQARTISGGTVADQRALAVADLAAPDCVLFMWMVDWAPRLALDVIEGWGFEHKTTTEYPATTG